LIGSNIARRGECCCCCCCFVVVVLVVVAVVVVVDVDVADAIVVINQTRCVPQEMLRSAAPDHYDD